MHAAPVERRGVAQPQNNNNGPGVSMPKRVVDLSQTVNLHIVATITRQRVADLLCSAVEGGSGYWANFLKAQQNATFDYLSVELEDTDTEKTYVVNLRRMHVGLMNLADRATGRTKPTKSWHFSAKAAARHLNDFLTENDDASTADVVLQFAIFNEVLYG